MIFQSTLRAALRWQLLAMPFLFVFCLPWVDLGIWRQTETVSVVLHAMSGLSVLLLGGMILGGSRRALGAVRHPVTLAFAGIAALTFLQAAVNPLDGFDADRTLHGLLKHGVGGLWHLDVAILIAAYLAVSNSSWRSRYAWSALAALTAAAALTWLFIGKGSDPWVPYDFTGWLGIFAVLAAAAGFASPDRRIHAFALVVGAFGLFVGRNATAYAAVLTCLVGYAAWRWRPVGPSVLRRAALVASLLSLAGIAVLLPLATGPLEAFAVRHVDAATMQSDGIPSDKPIDHVAIDKAAYGTVWSRGWMVRTVISNLAAHPAALAFGRGWGSFPEVYTEEMRTVPGRVFTQPSETSSKAFWDPHRKADFHSHNMMMETLLSLGIPGMLLMGFAFLSPLLFARKGNVAAAAFLTFTFCTIGGMWFLVNTLAPVLALAFASVSRVRLPQRRIGLAPLAGTAAACLASGLAMFFFASILFGISLAERQARYFEPMEWLIAPPCRAISGWTAPAREVNVTVFRRFVEAGEGSKVPFAWFAQRAKTAVNYACILRDLSDHGNDAVLLDASLDLRHRLLQSSGNFPVIVKMMKVDISYWGDDIRRLLTMAPDRTDAIIPYVSWLILKGDKKEAVEAMDKLGPLVMPGDPVADWIEARRAELAGDAALYHRKMASALRGGIANLVRLRRVDAESFLKPFDAGKPEASKPSDDDAAAHDGAAR